MTAQQIVSAFRAKGRDPKWRAKCPAHQSRGLTLAIYRNRDKVGLHCFAGCDARDILGAVGLRLRDLYPDSPMLPHVRARISLQDYKESLEAQVGYVAMMHALERGKGAYWEAAERRIRHDLFMARLDLEPEKLLQEVKMKAFHQQVAKFGIEKLWEEVYGPSPRNRLDQPQ